VDLAGSEKRNNFITTAPASKNAKVQFKPQTRSVSLKKPAVQPLKGPKKK
jgi:hypothetical protein